MESVEYFNFLPVDLVGIIGEFLNPKEYYCWISQKKLWWELYGEKGRFYKRLFKRKLFKDDKDPKAVLLNNLTKVCDKYDLYITGKLITEQILGWINVESAVSPEDPMLIFCNLDQVDIIIPLYEDFPEEGYNEICDVLGITHILDLISQKMNSKFLWEKECLSKPELDMNVAIWRVQNAKDGNDAINSIVNNVIFPTRFIGYNNGQFKFDKNKMKNGQYFRKCNTSEVVVKAMKRYILNDITGYNQTHMMHIIFEHYVRTVDSMIKVDMDVQEGIKLLKYMYEDQSIFTIMIADKVTLISKNGIFLIIENVSLKMKNYISNILREDDLKK